MAFRASWPARRPQRRQWIPSKAPAGGATVQATAAASFGGLFAAVGAVTVPATASAALGGTFTATATVTVPAAAAASFGGSFSATGSVTVGASAAASFGGSFSATGTVEVPAAASALFGGSFAAVATVIVPATAAASFGGLFAATATVTRQATAAASFGGSFSAVGTLASDADLVNPLPPTGGSPGHLIRRTGSGVAAFTIYVTGSITARSTGANRDVILAATAAISSRTSGVADLAGYATRGFCRHHVSHEIAFRMIDRGSVAAAHDVRWSRRWQQIQDADLRDILAAIDA